MNATQSNLMQAHLTRAISFGRRYGGGDEQYEGCAIDALLRCAERYSDYDVPRFVTLLRLTTRTMCANLRKKLARQGTLAVEVPARASSTIDVDDAIASLGPLAAFARAAFLEGATVREIAQTYGVPASRVHAGLQSCKARLRYVYN